MTADDRHDPTLRILRSHGIPVTSLHDVFRATVIAKLTYCAPSWFGACSAADRAKLESFVSQCKRLAYCSSEVPTYSDLTDEVEPWPTMDMFYRGNTNNYNGTATGLNCLLDSSTLVPKCLDSVDPLNQHQSVSVPICLWCDVSGYPSASLQTQYW